MPTTPEDQALASELRALGFTVVIDEWPPNHLMTRWLDLLHARITANHEARLDYIIRNQEVPTK